MRIIGWCYKCRRVRQVRVTHLHPGGIQVGICAACEKDE